MILFHPKAEPFIKLDPHSRDLMCKTISFFENRGKARLKHDDHERIWYADFLSFVKDERVFATLMTPQAEGEAGARWDTYRNSQFNEILGFYGLNYWYTWQVTMLGLGPIWMSENQDIKRKTVQLLRDGGIFAFGLSEKEHGADLYSSEMALIPQANGNYQARGRKYYIGNGNKAALVSTFGKIQSTGDYVFFAVDSQNPNYECVQSVVNAQNYVAEFALHDYPIAPSDILSTGKAAWDASLNTINICKFNLGWASIGMCTHAFYETIHHASHRHLFNHYVTDFPHIQQLLVDAYSRLVAMKVFARRATDYMRSASAEDRRYLLYNPMVKMKVTTQGEEVMNLLADVIAAKGFEKDMIFESVMRDIRALPKLEGTVHVNMALIIKFMKNFFFKPGDFSEVPRRDDPSDDTFLFHQGATQGLGKIRFHDYRRTFDRINLPNVRIFKKQARILKMLLAFAPPRKEQTQDFDFLLVLGELFTLVAYGQLLIEGSKIDGISDELLDQLFDFMIRDFSKFALQLYTKTTSTRLQRLFCKCMIRKPTVNHRRFERIWQEHVLSLKNCYMMTP